jgi:hypothetical protein
MDNKELLYEISLKYNTLKMYENTISQMVKNGASDKSLEAIESERASLENEFEQLLSQKTESINVGGYRTNPKVDRENEFLKKAYEDDAKRKDEYEYEVDYGVDEYTYDDNWGDDEDPPIDEEENNRPRLADIQDKISNSKWISSSNFILRFPKDEINIDEWRVSSFSYTLNAPKTSCFCSPYDDEITTTDKIGGTLYVKINDFSDKINDYQYNILSKIYLNLTKNNVLNGNIHVDVIDNGGDLLYTIVFEKCRFVGTGGGCVSSFAYDRTDLNCMSFCFEFKNIVILAPNEKLRKED